MKKLVILIAMMALAWVNPKLSAQDREYRHRMGPDPDRMLECLDLTAEQQVSMKAVHDDFLAEMKKVREDEELDPAEQREQIKTLHDHLDDQVSKILTDEQLQEFHQNRRPAHGRNDRMDFDDEFHSRLLEKRKEFDRLLSVLERETISKARNELMLHREQMWQADGDPCVIPPENRRAARDSMQERLRVLDPIIENHRDELMAIRKDIGAPEGDRRGMKPRYRQKAGQGRRDQGQFLRERHFLLLDPDRGSIPGPGMIDAESGEVKLFPNPVTNSLNIEFQTRNDGKVTIEMLDKGGELMNLIEESCRDSGNHTLTVDVSGLDPGELYYVRITCPARIYVIKFIKL